jgi:hypothetical protein
MQRQRQGKANSEVQDEYDCEDGPTSHPLDERSDQPFERHVKAVHEVVLTAKLASARILVSSEPTDLRSRSMSRD